MKKGEIYTGVVESVDFPNKGVVLVEDQKVIVKNTIPGQKISFRIQKKKNGRCEAQLLAVEEAAKEELSRENPEVCPHFGICGGCQYQTLPYEKQLALKQAQVKKLLAAVVKGEFLFQPIEGSPIAKGYRNKMEFSFGDEVKDGPLALGMHKRGSFYDVVTTDACNIVHEDFCKILKATKSYFEELGVPFYKKMQHSGYLRHLLVRRAVKTGEILVALVTTTQTGMLKDIDLIAKEDRGQVEEIEKAQKAQKVEQRLIEAWVKKLLELDLEGRFAGILQIQNDSLADVVQSDCTKILYGEDFFYEELLGLKFKISPFSFFQTNSLGAEVLYEKVREYIGDTRDKVVFDLYSGTGTIAQIAAAVAKKVVGVEIVEEAVEAAKENAARNQIFNCEFLAGDVLKVVGTLEDKPDLIVLDPPRDGIHPKALEKIIGFGVDKMVYVSCKPTSLARDLVVLQERGYKVEKVCCVDMFPATGGIETVCLLSKQEI
ncbi:MAG: 23S rRNA (uracil(1939)-C(5))-methyltransferase RlmD [bacterium]|nr:23S rRNA (uracil(1939)-C(5))-methyltransferase RlmD [bacterium]